MLNLTEQELKEIIESEIRDILEGSRVEAAKIDKVKEMLAAALAKVEFTEKTVNPQTSTSREFPAAGFYVDDLFAALSDLNMKYR